MHYAQKKGCGWGRVLLCQPPTGGSFRKGETLSKRLSKDRATGTAMPGANGPRVGTGPPAGANTPRGGVPLDKEGMQGKQKESSGEESAGLCVCGGGGGSRNATFQEVGRILSVPPPQSQSRKRALTLPQPTAEGVPSQPSTFGGVVSNGHKPGGAAERKGCRAGSTGVHPSSGGVSHKAPGGPAQPKPGTAWKMFTPVTYGQ